MSFKILALPPPGNDYFHSLVQELSGFFYHFLHRGENSPERGRNPGAAFLDQFEELLVGGYDGYFIGHDGLHCPGRPEVFFYRPLGRPGLASWIGRGTFSSFGYPRIID